MTATAYPEGFKEGWDALAELQLVGNPVIYAVTYPIILHVGREHGYAIALHGSVRRDMDVVAVPWTEEAGDPDALVQAVASAIPGAYVNGGAAEKPHGRRAWVIVLGSGCYLDFGVMPRGGV